MTDTAINALTYVPENTTDPAAGLNITIDQIDALLQPVVIAIQDDPPSGASDGDRYIVGTGSGDWAGEDDKLAVYRLTGDFWDFYTAKIAIIGEAIYVNDGGWAPYLDRTVNGRLTINFASDANLTLSTDAGAEQWLDKFLTLTDSGVVLTAGRDVIFPALNGPEYIVTNSTAQTLTFKISGQTGVAVTTGNSARIYYDGTDMVSGPS